MALLPIVTRLEYPTVIGGFERVTNCAEFYHSSG